MNERKAYGYAGGFQSDVATEREVYPVTDHARKQLAARWPDTVLRPSDFGWLSVPTDAPLIGYDPASTAMLLAVPSTPMVAIVVGGVVATFLTRQAAESNIALRGYGVKDFELQQLSDAKRAQRRELRGGNGDGR